MNVYQALHAAGDSLYVVADSIQAALDQLVDVKIDSITKLGPVYTNKEYE